MIIKQELLSGTNAGGGTNINLSYDNPVEANHIIIFVNLNGTTITGNVTYNGVAMTLRASHVHGHPDYDLAIYAYTLENAASGINNLEFTCSAETAQVGVFAYSASGVTAIKGAVANEDMGYSGGKTLTETFTTNAGDIIVDALRWWRSAADFTAGAGQTAVDDDSPTRQISAHKEGAAGTTDMSYTTPEQALAMVYTGLVVEVDEAPATDLITNGLQLRLDAADIIGLNDNDPVEVWEDASLGGNNAVQSVVGNRPIYKVNALNGLPVVRFSGGHFLAVDSFESSLNITNNTLSIFAVFVSANTKDSSILEREDIFNKRGNYSFQFSVSRQGALSSAMRANEVWHSYQTLKSRWSANTPYLVTTIRDQASASKSFWVNGEHDSTHTMITQDIEGHNVLKIGTDDSEAYFLNGDIAEILIYDRALTAQERESNELYLMGKWGVVVEDIQLQYYEVPVIRSVVKTLSYEAQTVREVSILQEYVVQLERNLTGLISYAGQTTRKVNKLISYTGQTTRKVNKLISYTGQTVRNVTKILSTFAYTGQLVRNVTKMISYTGQTVRNVVGLPKWSKTLKVGYRSHKVLKVRHKKNEG